MKAYAGYFCEIPKSMTPMVAARSRPASTNKPLPIKATTAAAVISRGRFIGSSNIFDSLDLNLCRGRIAYLSRTGDPLWVARCFRGRKPLGRRTNAELFEGQPKC